MDVEIESRVERLNRMMDEGRIIRNDWTGIDEQGRETACLLAALAPEVAAAETASACPASLMPTWFAYLTPWLDDYSSAAEWPRVIRRYAACAARWSVLDDAAWRRVEIVARRVAVVEAMRHTTDEQILAGCRGVLTWLDADMPEEAQAAVAVEAAASWATEARAAAVAVAASAVWSASVAVWSAASAATAAAAASASATALSSASAADRIVDAVLSALEQECALAVR